MKKVLFSVLALTFTAGTQVFAQDQAQVNTISAPASPVATTTATAGATIATDASEDNRTAVDPANLPEAIKKTLASDQYKGWQLVSASLVKGKTEYYELQMKKGEETTALKLDKNGNVVS
ncbi:MAG: hypothetical protein JNL13_13160 [Chitinophagaceae bacterium]|nr:hypothetical protein [Chitinophagaceae bacterium]